MVHQHFMLIPVMTVAENIVLAAEPRKGVLLDRDAARTKVRELSERYGLAVDPDATVEDITVGAQQRVEILRALYRGAEVLVLDEPTAVLTAQETAELFDVLRELKARDVGIIFISHKLNEVLEIADRITVLQRGRKVATLDAKDATEPELARLMVGREVLFRLEKHERSLGEPMLELEDLHATDDRGLPALDGVSLTVHGGEVVGIAGVDGNGQTELVECITGLRRPTGGRISVAGKEIGGTGVVHALDAGVGHIPEDRHRRGLVLDFDLAENLALREYRRAPMARRGTAVAQAHAGERGAAAEDVRRPRRGPGHARLVAVGRQPAEGRDRARAGARIRACWWPRSRRAGSTSARSSSCTPSCSSSATTGGPSLLVSLELEELRNVADRLLVIADGKIVARVRAGCLRRGARPRDDRRDGRVSAARRGVRAPSPWRPASAASCAAAASRSRSSPRCWPSSPAASSSWPPARTRSPPTRRSSTAPA